MTGSVSNILPFQTYFYLESPDSRSWVKKHNEIKKKAGQKLLTSRRQKSTALLWEEKEGPFYLQTVSCEVNVFFF